ncbi:MAG: GDP-mannose 4,6-dehydratase [Terriglobales bacterium]
MPILITGGTGFVGNYLVQLLTQRGHSIAIISSGIVSQEEPGVQYYEADVRDRDRVQGIVKEVNPAQVYHLAGVTAVDASWANPRMTYEVNFWGACNAFEAAMRLASPPIILNVSTSQVYAQSTEKLSESSPLAPDNPYSTSKAMAELLRIEFKNCSAGGIVTARPFNHSGPGQTPNFVLPSMAKQFAEIELGLRPPKLILGNTRVKRDFTDVRDVVEAYALLLDQGRVGETYNVCSGTSVRLSEIIKMFEAASGTEVEVEVDVSKIRPNETVDICGDPGKISEIGWSPKIPLQKTIADLLDYWRSVLREARSAAC